MKIRNLLIKRADTVFSLYVRYRGATYGYNHCYTCGAYLPVEDLQAGHFISRRFLNTRWHALNVWPQCNRCNVELSGNIEVYEQKLKAQFSELAIEALWDIARSGHKVTEFDLREIIKQYK